jgi:uncharacterized membrane protein
VNVRATSSYLREFRWYRRSRLWVLPTVGVATALLLAVASLTVDALVLSDHAPFPVFYDEADTARSILALIATSIATLTALVLTIVAVVLQLANQTLSPRAVRTFLQDPMSHVTIGVFVTTFTYALVVLQQLGRIRDPEADLLASTSVTIAFVLAVVSIGMFIAYVDHIIHQARVTSVIERIGNDTLEMIDREYPSAEDAAEPVVGEVPDREPDLVIRSPRRGHILEIDIAQLLEVTSSRDVLVVMVPAVGDFIPTDGRLFELYGATDLDGSALADTVVIDAERSITQDVPFGFRLLVDIGERALSPGVNDPTTAVQSIDTLYDLLLRLGHRPFPNGWFGGGQGTPRLFVSQPTWELYVALAFEELRHYGADSLQVVRRLRSVVLDLLREVPEERRAALRRQLRLLDDAVESGFASELEREAARHPDAQGIGSGGGFEPNGDDASASV